MSKKIIALIIVILWVSLGYVFFVPKHTAEFLVAYEAYSMANSAHVAAAHVPGGGNNPARQKLNGILPRVLTENFSPEERQKLSEEALASVLEIRAEIDAIGREGEKADAALSKLREASEKVGGFSAGRKARGMVAFAEERIQTLKNIQEISYGINTRLENIFRGIIRDHGALTAERILLLNQDLPEAEKQFDRLTESYRKLDDIEKKISTEF
jgi:hypothetical protein